MSRTIATFGWRATTANSGHAALVFSPLPAGGFRRLQPQLGDFRSQPEAIAFRRWRASLLYCGLASRHWLELKKVVTFGFIDIYCIGIMVVVPGL